VIRCRIWGTAAFRGLGTGVRSLAVINQQGGVGKTATAVNLGHALARQGQRVLLADLDPQGRLAASLGIFRPPRHGMDRVLLDGAPFTEHRIATRELLSLVPAGGTLEEVERPGGGMERARCLRRALELETPDVDWLIFDCPPAANLLVANAMLAVDQVLIPVTGDPLSLTGLARLLLTLKGFDGLRPRALDKSLFLSRFLPRRRLARAVRSRLLTHFPQQLLATAVREAAVVAECSDAGRTIFEYRPRSKSAGEFQSLARDFTERRLLCQGQERICDVA